MWRIQTETLGVSQPAELSYALLELGGILQERQFLYSLRHVWNYSSNMPIYWEWEVMCDKSMYRPTDPPRTAEQLLAELKRKQEYAATQGMDLDEVEKEERDSVLRDSVR